MKKIFHPNAIITLRLLFGLNFMINGLNPFFHFYELPNPSPASAALATALIESGYLFLLVKIVEIGAGILLLINRLIPLTLVIIFPISLNIFLFNLFLEPNAAPIGIIVLAVNVYLCLGYYKYYKPMLAAKTPIE